MTNNQQKRIGDFEIVNFGIVKHRPEYHQYYLDFENALTCFKNVVTGVGNNPAEVIDDCLEQIAKCGFDTEGMEARIIEQEGWGTLPTTPDRHWWATYGSIEDIWYYVSIQWNEER